MQNKLQTKCKQLIKQNEHQKDSKYYQRLIVINKMLNIPNCFMYIAMDTALSMLVDLGYTKEQSIQLYKTLTKYKKEE